METKIAIYCLKCPIENKVKYIGKTKDSILNRLSAHMGCRSENVELNMWIKSLREKGLKPSIHVIEFAHENDWCVREQYWIEKYMSRSITLYNKPLDKNNLYYILREYQKVLIRCNYSYHTRKNYCANFYNFLLAFKGKDYQNISKQDVIDYISSLVELKNISVSYQNVVINSLKFFFEKVLNGQRTTYFIQRPQKEYYIRPIMSPAQVDVFLHSLENIKHLTVFSLMYGGGMRSSEVVSILIEDISFEECTIKLRQAKGKKDRIIVVPSETINLIHSYIEEVNPVRWLFEGQNKNEHWSQRSLQEVFKHTKKKLGFDSSLRPHDLRGSRSTHLMDAGMKIENVAKQYGHNSTNTISKSYYHYETDTIKEQMAKADINILKKLNHQKQIQK